MRSLCTSHACNFQGRICGNESQLGLHCTTSQKTGYATPLNYGSRIKGQSLMSASVGW